jgi:import receptor subunit TOM22
MVELVEVEDESFENKQVGPSDEEDDYTDTGTFHGTIHRKSDHSDLHLDSEISTDDEDNIADDETLTDRLLALRDIIPPTTRSYISSTVDSTTGWIKSGLLFSGKTLWIVSTSALLLGVPWALAFAEEQQMVEMEKEMKMRESGQDVRSAMSF